MSESNLPWQPLEFQGAAGAGFVFKEWSKLNCYLQIDIKNLLDKNNVFPFSKWVMWRAERVGMFPDWLRKSQDNVFPPPSECISNDHHSEELKHRHWWWGSSSVPSKTHVAVYIPPSDIWHALKYKVHQNTFKCVDVLWHLTSFQRQNTSSSD